MKPLYSRRRAAVKRLNEKRAGAKPAQVGEETPKEGITKIPI
jgi:hypothetical protein